ncbi:MAG: sensor histidine kinase, partial [Chloroflexota bacterium]
RSILRLGEGARPPTSLTVSENGMALREVVIEALENEDHIGEAAVQLPLPNEGDTERRSYQAVASVVPGENGTAAQVVVILRDVTEQMRLEYAKSNFLSVVSHELRTPLSSIKGFLNIILSERTGTLNETQKDFLTTAKGQSEYLHAMINDLVEFSRIQVRRTALDVDLVSLTDVTRAVCARLLPLAQDKNLSLVNLVPADLPLIDGDQLRLDQVVSNLVSNAVKFTPEGGTITVLAREEGDEVVYSVRDTGVGIPGDQQERIFEPFYQVSEGPSRLHGGMGLGLAICRHVIERHEGRLFVESVEGQGSAFHFALPKHSVSHEPTDLRLALQS